jgi:hypothetical protein
LNNFKNEMYFKSKKCSKKPPNKTEENKKDRKISKTKEANRTTMKKIKEYVKRRYVGYARPISLRSRVDALTRANRQSPQKLGGGVLCPVYCGSESLPLASFFSVIC